MPHYRYTTVDDAGRRVRGEAEAASEAALGESVRRQGRWLAEVREVTERRRGTPGGVGNRRVPRAVLMQYFLSVGLQLRAGVTTFNALAFGLDQKSHAGFRAIHADLLERVRAGEALSAAMAAHPKTFSPVVCNLVRAGEASGRLAEVCEDIREHYEWTDRLAAEIRQAVFYPAAVLVAVVGFLVVVFTFFIPRFTGVLRELGVPLPALTRGMIALSDFLRDHHLALGLTGLVVGGGLVAAAWGVPGVARRWHALQLRLPVLGPILAQVCLARFTQNLSSLYRAGIPVLEALALCQGLVGNRWFEEGVASVAEGVRAGRPMHESMRFLPVFPTMVVQMTALGETTGSLDETLQRVAGYYQAIVPRAVKRLFAIFEPVMVLGLLVLIGVVALSVVLPMAAALEAS